jgi:ribonuclease P protein component
MWPGSFLRRIAVFMEKTTVLTLNKDYKRLYYRGRSAVDPALVTYAMKNRLNSENRMGITVTKKIGKAVCRNRCKRVIRAAYRLLEPQLPSGWDFIFVARGKTADIKSTDLMPIMKKQIEYLTTTAQDKPAPKKSSAPKKGGKKPDKAKQNADKQ